MLGAVAGATVWLLLDQLGVPEIFGIGADVGLLPLTVLAAILGMTRVRFFLVKVAIVLLSLTFLIAYTPIMGSPTRSLIRSDPVPRSADAVVVLSGGLTADGLLTQQGIDRSLKGVELVENGVAPVLVFTREEKKGAASSRSSAEDQTRLAQMARLPKVFTTRKVTSTRDEALAVSSIAKYRGWRNIVLVTSPFHSRRACSTFERVGLFVSCVPSDSRDVAVKKLDDPHDRIAAFGLYLYELAGSVRYRIAGWI